MDETRRIEVRRLREVERLTMRQIAETLGLNRRTVARVLSGQGSLPPRKSSIVAPYERLLEEWFRTTPSLQAKQALQRLRGYGYAGGYTTIKQATKTLRRKRKVAFFELEFLPGEEAQVDWMEWKIGDIPVYGFVYVLAWSRYAFVRFYPRRTLEFFLDGHIQAFREVGGVAHRHRYDNLKSVVLRRVPQIQYNPAFLDFARHYGFSIHLCNIAKANEKGRVERLIRDIKDDLRVETFERLVQLNGRMGVWLKERHGRPHRTTRRAPAEMRAEEKLLPRPQIEARPYRLVTATISKTAFVEFDGNRYSVPTATAGAAAEVVAGPEAIEILVGGKRVAVHDRSFEKHIKVELPLHREGLLLRSPRTKFERIHALMAGLSPETALFLERTRTEGEDPRQAAYVLFRLLRGQAKETLLSAVREANALQIYKIKYVHGLLARAGAPEPATVRPQDERLLDLVYDSRKLDDYDDLI